MVCFLVLQLYLDKIFLYLYFYLFYFFFGFYFLKYKKISLKKFEFNFWFFNSINYFLIYLFYKNIFFYWKYFLIIPSFYLEIYETTLIDLIRNFIVYFLTDSFFNFIITPQYFVISIILISNTILIFLKILNKIDIPNNILYLSLLSCFLCSLSLKIEIFRLYTSVIIGLIPLLYFFHKIKNENLKSNLIKLLVLPSIFALFFYPLGNNPVFKNLNFKKNNLILLNNKFDFTIGLKIKLNRSI